jgi:NAD(P)H dehydrogenase (quinone)
MGCTSSKGADNVVSKQQSQDAEEQVHIDDQHSNIDEATKSHRNISSPDQDSIQGDDSASPAATTTAAAAEIEPEVKHRESPLLAVLWASSDIGAETIRSILRHHESTKINIRAVVEHPSLIKAIGDIKAPSVSVAVAADSKDADGSGIETALKGATYTLIIAEAPDNALSNSESLTNEEQWRAMVNAAMHQSVQHIVVACPSMMTDRVSHHMRTITEETLTKFTILQYHMLFEQLHQLRSIITNDRVLVGMRGNNRVAGVSLRDMASCTATMLCKDDMTPFDGRTLTITGAESLDGMLMATAFSSVLGRNTMFLDLAPAEFEASCRAHDIPGIVIRRMLRHEQWLNTGAAQHISGHPAELGGTKFKFESWVRANRGWFIDEAEAGDDVRLVSIVTTHAGIALAIVQALKNRYPGSQRICVGIPKQCVTGPARHALRLTGVRVIDSVDFEHVASFDRVLQNAESLILVPPESIPDYVQHCKDVVDAAVKHSIKTIIAQSWLCVSDDSVPALEANVMEIEAHIKASGIQWTSLRSALFMEHIASQMPRLCVENELIGVFGSSRVALVSLTDVGAAVAEVVCNPQQHNAMTYNLTGPESLDGTSLAEILHFEMGRPIQYRDMRSEVSEFRVLLAAQHPNWPNKQVDAYIELFMKYGTGAADIVSEDLSKIAGVQTDFASWLRENSDRFTSKTAVLLQRAISPIHDDDLKHGLESPRVTVGSASGQLGVLAGSSASGAATVRALARACTESIEKGDESLLDVHIRAGWYSPQSMERIVPVEEATNFANVDPDSEEALRGFFFGLSTVFLIPPRERDDFEDITLRMINIAHDCEVKHIVLLSVIGCNAELTALQRVSWSLEQHVESYAGLGWTHVRCATLTDTLTGFAASIAEHSHFRGFHGDTKTATVTAYDVGCCVAKIMLQPDEHHASIYNLTGGELLSNVDRAATLTQVLFKQIEYIDMTDQVEQLQQKLQQLGWPEWQIDAFVHDGDNDFVSNDIAGLLARDPIDFATWAEKHAAVLLGDVPIDSPNKIVDEFDAEWRAERLQRANRRKVAVLCASSGTGFAAVKALLVSFHDSVTVVAAVHSASKASLLQGMDVEVRPGLDFAIDSTVESCVEDAEAVLIIAPNFVQNRDKLTMNAINVCAKRGVKHIVLISMLGAADGDNLFERQFQSMEDHAKQSGMSWTLLRCAFFMDNFLGSAPAIRVGKLFGTHGAGKFTSVSLSDVGKCAAAILAKPDEHKKATYSLTGPGALNGDAYAGTFSTVLGHPVSYSDQERKDFTQVLQHLGWPAWQAEGQLDVFDSYKQGKFNFVSDHVRKLIGRVTDFESWVRDHANFFTDSG